MKFRNLFYALAIVTAGLTASISAQAAQSAATVAVTPQESSSQVMPDHPAQQANSFFYTYTVTDGGKVSDSIPVQMCLSSSTGTWVSFDVKFGDPSGSAGGVTVPGNTTFQPVDLSTCKTATITIDTDPLVLADATKPEVRVANINVQATGKNPNSLSVQDNNFPTIHIRYEISPATNDTACFTTDGDGNLLATCDGIAVTESGSNGGRFSINANKRNEEVSTNPGQFYYNILWTNMTGADQVVNVSFGGSGASAKGANAIHASVFPPSFSGVTPEGFQAVNDDIPGGSDGSITAVTVPAGWTLWADYHVDWSGIGQLVPDGIATTCGSANQVLSITGTVTGVDLTRSCTSGALGYKKTK